MKNAQKVLESHTSSTPSQWREKAAWRRENRNWLKSSQHIAMTVLDCMDTKKMSQKELAEKMGVSPQYICKLLKGSENLSLETITKLEVVLNMKIFVIQNFFAKQSVTPMTNWTSPKFIEIKPARGIKDSYKTTYMTASCEELGAA